MAERVLKWLLRLLGVSCLFALPAMVMPVSWMAAAHEWSGLGKFPDAPVVVYLARAVSGFYAMFGGLMLIAASDARRYATIITYCAWLGILFSAAIVCVILAAGMPWYWAMGEAVSGPPTGIIILLLQRAAAKPGTAT
jgi:hypothetical protein